MTICIPKEKWEEFTSAWVSDSKYRNMSYGQALYDFFSVGSIFNTQIEMKAKRLYISKDTNALNVFFEIFEVV